MEHPRKNYVTPRTMAEGQWTTGYYPPTPAERFAGTALATLIGVLLALALVHWWAS